MAVVSDDSARADGLEFLTAAIGRKLRGEPSLLWRDPEPQLWRRAATIARRSKLLAMLAAAVEAEPGSEMARVIAADGAEARAAIMAANAPILLMARAVRDALSAADIRYVLFKGAIQQQVLHGTFFARPAGDLDILVDRQNFADARQALARQGYFAPPECNGMWWRVFLGEQHLFRPAETRLSLDLHFRVQQPGCPAPRATESFLDAPLFIPLGSTEVPTLTPVKAALLASISIVKAIYNREHAGSHVVDLATATTLIAPTGWEQLDEAARRQGLSKTLALALRVVFAAFGGQPPPRSPVPEIDDATLRRMVFTADDPAIAWTRRRDILRALCDRPMRDYLVESAWALLSEAARRLGERRIDPTVSPKGIA